MLKVFDTHVADNWMITPLTNMVIDQLSTIFVPKAFSQLVERNKLQNILFFFTRTVYPRSKHSVQISSFLTNYPAVSYMVSLSFSLDFTSIYIKHTRNSIAIGYKSLIASHCSPIVRVLFSCIADFALWISKLYYLIHTCIFFLHKISTHRACLIRSHFLARFLFN